MAVNRRIKIFHKLRFIVSTSILVLSATFPILWIILTSFKQKKDLMGDIPKFIFSPTIKYWKEVLFATDFIKYYRNSVIIATSTTVMVTIIAIMAGYSLVRGNYRFRNNIAFFILSQRMMPAVAVVLPIYVFAAQLRALDRLETLIFINVAFNLPLAVWMIRGFIEGLSESIEEAALIDGCSRFGAFLRIGLPQTLPGLLSTSLLVFIYTFNEFFFALILSGTRARPVTVAMQLFLPTGVRGTLFGEAAVASLLIMCPSLILAIFMQKYLVSGISLGALRE